MLSVKEFLIKQRLLWLLKSRSRRTYVSVFFDRTDVVFLKSGKRRNECIAVQLPKEDIDVLRNHLYDGDFIVFAGGKHVVLKFILANKRKWRKLVHWYRV
ncbi:hypothetical protein AB3331_09375 [Streptococcus sp. H49]|uniref:hypothetical protein n=1 Tax=Streptococcus huangxiaojuni TaxID=3237239 RepID=UPI0034A55429